MEEPAVASSHKLSASHGAQELSADHHYQEELAQYKSPREWWRTASLPGGDPAGFVIPAHNGYDPIIAYIGVRPRYRGRVYVNELLAEGTRILAAEGVPRIRASTDLGNVPMPALSAGLDGLTSVTKSI
jgi:ribosomal protein S18 acetylase RimI-like enzyme